MAMVAVATSSSTPTMMTTPTWSSTTTVSRVDGGAAPADGAIGEELDAVVIGVDLGVQIRHGEILRSVDPNGSEEGIVGVVEAGQEHVHLFLTRSGDPDEVPQEFQEPDAS